MSLGAAAARRLRLEGVMVEQQSRSVVLCVDVAMHARGASDESDTVSTFSVVPVRWLVSIQSSHKYSKIKLARLTEK
jgi:hypothetical protein